MESDHDSGESRHFAEIIDVYGQRMKVTDYKQGQGIDGLTQTLLEADLTSLTTEYLLERTACFEDMIGKDGGFSYIFTNGNDSYLNIISSNPNFTRSFRIVKNGRGNGIGLNYGVEYMSFYRKAPGEDL